MTAQEAVKKYINDSGAIPVNVLVKTRAIVTAGLANEVEEVNQYPAVIKSETPIATEDSSFFRINNIVNIRPDVAITSLTNNGVSPRILDDT